jgi:dTDP-L-rhamnose 4-epimerase
MLILVTGGAGFIGSHTSDRLLRLGYKVRIFDSLEKPVHMKGKPDYLPKEAEFVKGDVRDRSALKRVLKGVDAVYHFAAFQDNLPNFSKYFDVNATGTALLYELILEGKLDIKKVVVASSQAVMGEGKYRCKKDGEVFPNLRSIEQLKKGDWEVRCPECNGKVVFEASDEKVVNPQNQYGISKFAQETIAMSLGRNFGIPTVCLRYSIVQGPRQSFYNPYSGACRAFCLNLLFKKSPQIFEDGKQIRDYVNIEDVVDANILALYDKRADYQVFNVGGGRGYSVLQFYKIVCKVFECDIEPKVKSTFRLGDVRHILSDIGKLKKLGWRPKLNPEKSVRDYREWLLSRPLPPKTLLNKQEKMRSKIVGRSRAV